MERSQLEEILANWRIDTIADWHVIQDGVIRITLVDGRQFVLKQHDPSDEAAIGRVHFEYEVLQHVKHTGVAVAVPLLSTQGTPYAIASDHIFRLFDWLPNRPTDVQTDEERTKLYRYYGEAIGSFHQALASYIDDDILSKTWRTDLQTRIIDESLPVVAAHLDQARLSSFQTFLAEIAPEMTSAYANLPMQLIIWDCHPGNVAVDGLEVSGFIDCDHISVAPRVFDLANFLVHLIKWNVGDEQSEAMWLAHFRQVTIGYESVVPLSRNERLALFYGMAGIPLLFMDFFFQGGQPELCDIEFDTFVWLVRHRSQILAQLETIAGAP